VLGADLFGEPPVVESLRRSGRSSSTSGPPRRRPRRGRVAPHRRKYLLLNHRLSIRLLDASRAWVDEVEAELDG